MSKPLSPSDIERLKRHGIEYPWMPQDALRLLDTVSALEQRLAVAVDALETVAKYDSHLRIVGSNARAALSRIGAGKEGE